MTAQPNSQALDTWPSRLESAQLGLDDRGQFKPVSVSLTPLVLNASAWKMVQVTARAIGTLLLNVSKQPLLLNEALSGLNPDSFARQLLECAPSSDESNAINVNLSRHDFLQDKQGNWKLVESNTIAAGMGPFSDGLQTLLSKHDGHGNFAPNDSATHQARVFVKEAQRVSENNTPTIVFVVEASEDNIYDHLRMREAFENEGATVHIRTLNELQNSMRTDSEKLILDDLGHVSGLYFRTGYNAQDYGDILDSQKVMMHFRGYLETKRVAISPTIRHQLASNKWVQMKLSMLSVSELMETFQLSTQQAVLAHLALHTPQKPAQNETNIQGKIASGDWLLKTQGEGGGNIVCKHNLHALPTAIDGAVLMKTIEPKPRATDVLSLNDQEFQTIEHAQSELGVFTAGDHQSYAGYLLRTKPISAVESGVHRGSGMIDTVQIKS